MGSSCTDENLVFIMTEACVARCTSLGLKQHSIEETGTKNSTGGVWVSSLQDGIFGALNYLGSPHPHLVREDSGLLNFPVSLFGLFCYYEKETGPRCTL